MEQQQQEKPTAFHWPPLESNPEIFTSYMQDGGMSTEWAFSELFGFDPDLLGFVPRPVQGVIINAQYLKKGEERDKGDPAAQVDFYMDQSGTLDNACGLVACLHAIFNNQGSIQLGDGVLKNYLENVKSKTPAEKCLFLENFKEFQDLHTKHALDGQSAMPGEQSGVKHHYVAFVVDKNQRLIELDGCKKGPLVIKEGCQDVLLDSVAEIQRKLAAGEISDQLSCIALAPSN